MDTVLFLLKISIIYGRVRFFHPLKLVGLFQVASDKTVHTARPLGFRGLEFSVLFDDVAIDGKNFDIIVQNVSKYILLRPETHRLAFWLF